MPRFIHFIIACFIISTALQGQNASIRLQNAAVRVDHPEMLSDSVYQLLSQFQIIMLGEMHGTTKPAQLAIGLARLFSEKGDSILLGMEIIPEQMQIYLSERSDSSIYKSIFFANPPQKDGRASIAWAKIIASLNDNPKVQIFFFDRNKGEEEQLPRDSLMYIKIRNQYLMHPGWRMITLSGNAHTRNEPDKMISYLKRDSTLADLSKKICSLNNYYSKGTCETNFGRGLELKYIEQKESVYDTALSFPDYIYLFSSNSNAPYTGMYYTRYMTPSKMVFRNQEFIDTATTNQILKAIYERDQKTRTRGDSAQYMAFIDSTNQTEVIKLINKYGWLDKSTFGNLGNYVCFLVIQHAPLEVQKQFEPLFMQSVEDGESRAKDLAMLQDRIRIRENKKQIYGTQLVPDLESGGWKFHSIEDEKNVNSRRAKVGLEPLEEYAKRFGIDYKINVP